MSEFKINNFITLKLEEGRTNIYVLGEEFIQCKYLLMNIPIQDPSYQEAYSKIISQALIRNGKSEIFKSFTS